MLFTKLLIWEFWDFEISRIGLKSENPKIPKSENPKIREFADLG